MKRPLSLEMRNAIVWIERQPEVTSVVQGRFTASRHKHAPGFTRIVSTDKKTVHLRTFDKKGSKDLFVYAPQSPLRDRWVAAIAGGNVLDEIRGPKLNPVKSVPPTTTSGQSTINVPTPKPLNSQAGQLFNVTPELAAKWLERNTRNRDLRNVIVERYAADMKAGRWMVTGDAIAFDKNGCVVNGQHRLWAVIYAEMAVPMLVAFDLEPDVVKVLDDHLKRGLTDVLKVSRPGVAISTKMTAVSRMMQQASIALTSTDKRNVLARLSRQQQIEFLDKHFDAISFAFRDVFKSSNVRGVTSASTVAAVGRAYYTQDHDRLRQFGKVLVSGMVEDPAADTAAILLRNWLLNNSGQMRAASEVIYRKSERACLAFCNREKIKMLYEASEELFYLPEDKAPKKSRAS